MHEIPRLVYVNPANPKQQMVTTQLGLGVPTGWILSNTSDGSCQCVDGATDQNLQVFVGGLWSGGYPAYNGYTDGSATNGKLGAN